MLAGLGQHKNELATHTGSPCMLQVFRAKPLLVPSDARAIKKSGFNKNFNNPMGDIHPLHWSTPGFTLTPFWFSFFRSIAVVVATSATTSRSSVSQVEPKHTALIEKAQPFNGAIIHVI
jgi:hypothetical protein